MTTYHALVERIACGLNDCRLEQRCSLWRVLAIGTGLAKCFEDTRWLADMRVFGMRKGMVADVRRAASRRRLAAVVANTLPVPMKKGAGKHHTPSLFNALNTLQTNVVSRCMSRHPRGKFIGFFDSINGLAVRAGAELQSLLDHFKNLPDRLRFI